MPDLRDSLAAAARNPMSQAGSAVATASGVMIVTLMVLELSGFEVNPYLGILTYLVLPTIFAGGLALAVIGALRERRRHRDTRFPVIDLNLPRTRHRVTGFLVLVCVCVVILATATSGAIHFMEGNTFCGTVCHEVMSPHYLAFQRSPHASVHCVDCHVAPGAEGFLEAKLNGTRQMWGAVLGIHHRPIPTPVDTLPSNDVTCEQCHWPGKYYGIKPRLITRFAPDESNTETRTVLLMNVGGADSSPARGIHWHTNPDVLIRYRSDESRRQVHEVELTQPDGTVKRYFASGADDAGAAPWRTMQCIDCHNRPTHIFHEPQDALDEALDRGFIARDLPYIRREGERALRVVYGSHDAARAGIAADLADFYAAHDPQLAQERAADIRTAARVLAEIYENNVFPSMNIQWGTYPDFNGHTDATAGCFRCHAGNLATKEGEVITVDCRSCHTIVAWDEASPELLELLRTSGGPRTRAGQR